MPELSQLVRQRLASRAAGGDHPEADTLTAYAEQLLSTAERNRVLEHLAACSYCREVVALSLPEPVESVPGPALVTPRRAWRWKPALGLAASLAMLAVVTTLIIELPRKPATLQSARQSPAPANPAEQDNLKASSEPVQPESTAGPKAPAGEPRAAEPRTTESSHASAANGVAGGNAVSAARETQPSPAAVGARTDAVSSTFSSPAVADARRHERDYVNKQMFVGGQAGNDVAANPADVPAAPLPRLAQNQFPPPIANNTPLAFAGLPPQTQDKVSRSRQLSNPPNNHFGVIFPSLPALGRKVEALAKRSVPIPAGALSFSAMESRALNPAREEQVPSTDGADVKADLDATNAFTPRALAGGADANKKDRAVGSAASWTVMGGKLMKSGDAASWAEGYSGENIEFTAVTARGSNIWAGGVNAVLIHSVNGGASWERITLGASATGSITSIDAGGLDVHVKSSSGQEWSSQDGGKAWSLDK